MSSIADDLATRPERDLPYLLRRRPLLIEIVGVGMTLDEMIVGAPLLAAVVAWSVGATRLALPALIGLSVVCAYLALRVRSERRDPLVIAARRSLMAGATRVQVPRGVYADVALRQGLDPSHPWCAERHGNKYWVVRDGSPTTDHVRRT
jgi:hypothetical protein